NFLPALKLLIHQVAIPACYKSLTLPILQTFSIEILRIKEVMRVSNISVGVVIVSYKTASLTVNALASIAAERQVSSDLSIRAVVVDNASGDFEYINNAIEL